MGRCDRGLVESLTAKQQLFVDAYLSNGMNATDACRTAGYKGNTKTLTVVGTQNLAKPSIRAVIDKQREVLREQYAERRKGLLSDVDEVKAEIDEVKSTFPDNPNVRVQLIARRLDAIEKEAKLTGAYIKDADNPADLSTLADVVKRYRADVIEQARIFDGTNGKFGAAMPTEAEMRGEIERLCRHQKVDPAKLDSFVAQQELGSVG